MIQESQSPIYDEYADSECIKQKLHSVHSAKLSKQLKQELILLPNRLILQEDTLGAVMSTMFMKERLMQSTSVATLQEEEEI